MNKKNINVFVMVGDGQAAQKKQLSDGTIYYSGIIYDIWKKIKINLEKEYVFKEHYIKTTKYGDSINEIENGKYDIGITGYTIITNRLRQVNFTKPLIVSKDVILYKDKINIFHKMKLIFTKILLIPLVLLLILAIIFGYIMHYIEPHRYKKVTGISKQYGLRRSIFTIIAALFGEMGFLFENSSVTFVGMFIIIIIAVIAMVTLIMVQAEATLSLSTLLNKSSFNIYNLNTKTLLSMTSWALGTKFKLHGAKIIENKNNNSIEETIKQYLNNLSKYDGIPLDIYDASKFADKYGLNISKSDLGFSLLSFAVNKNNDELLDKINIEISTLHDNSELYNICKSRFHNESNPSYCIL